MKYRREEKKITQNKQKWKHLYRRSESRDSISWNGFTGDKENRYASTIQAIKYSRCEISTEPFFPISLYLSLSLPFTLTRLLDIDSDVCKAFWLCTHREFHCGYLRLYFSFFFFWLRIFQNENIKKNNNI